MTMTRRAAIAAGAAAPLAAAAGRPAAAQAARKGADHPVHRRIALGDVEATVLLSGTVTNPQDPHTIFGLNVEQAEFDEVSREAFLPVDRSQFFFQPVAVNTGGRLVLLDTGRDAEGIVAALEAAGYAPEDVDQVVITHMHGDHVGGLMRDGAPTFPNAAYTTGETEMAHWREARGDAYEANVAPLEDRFELVGDGAEVAPGLTATAMFGHTPGHMGYRLASGDRQLMLCADMTNHYVWSLAHPDWEVRFDMDKAAAAETRRRVLGMLADDRIPMAGYHMPFPALGFVERAGDDGFRWVPESYQFML